MIDPKELRIGNWVKNDGEYHQWLIDNFVSEVRDENGYIFFDPIPLTPGILEKAGFEDSWFGYSLGESMLYFQKIQNSSQYSLEFHWICGESNEEEQICQFEYLHQLQNIYHGLTGNELTIEL